MLLTPEEIVAITGTGFVQEIKNTKCRLHGNAMGSLRIFQDRFEWVVDGETTIVVISVPYETVDMLRVSAPDKSKVQLQAVLSVGEHVTFQFADSSKTKDQLLVDQKRARDQLQELVVRHRKLVSSQEKSISKSAITENESKKQMLKKSWVMKVLYQNLVVNNLMPADEFWRLYYKPHESFFEQPGVSNGFMFEVAGDMCPTGIKMNLTPEIIRQIYKTYPAIEKKFMEYVPHQMPEEQFWSKFFESHYFNRDRVPEFKRNDPFTETLEEDEAHIEAAARKKVGAVRKDKDLLSINDDDGLYSDRPELFNPILSDKKRLIRRLNDFSDRILEAALDPAKNDLVAESAPSTSAPKNDVDAHVHAFTELEGEHDEIVLEDDPVRAYEFYVKKPGIAEAEALNEKVKETILPEDLEYPDQELMLVDQEGVESDSEMGYEPPRIGRDVPTRFKKLGITIDVFDEICDEIIRSNEDSEDDEEICAEDLKIAKNLQHEYIPPQDEKAFPPLSGYLLQKLFTAHTVVFELSQQLRKLIALKTPSSTKQALCVATALTTFQKNAINDLKEDCNRELGRNGEKLVDYLVEAAREILHKCVELKDKIPV
jgi:hypothetical protein